ncbi:MAG: 2,3-bisphosphoglycerate-independent phosphoglycerate mutase [Planctomycetota bacterium]|nr:2,3-bisphosphoglycerate-independent phosphoglycerate mutase [Planctomycetota bacterium]
MLERHPVFPGVPGPVVTIIMDGIGLSSRTEGNAVTNAHTPVMDRLWRDYPHTSLKAHGTAVGMPSDGDMGNSEVGHNAMGAGQVFAQGAKLVSEAIREGRIWESAGWREVVAAVKESGGSLHLIGLVSDGNVHSHVDHLQALVERAKAEGLARVRVHGLLDGRDVPETSALDYFEPLETGFAALSDDAFDVRFASGGGRMFITMDRYEANWDMVARGWKTHVLGEGPTYASAGDAIRALREAHPGTIDQDLPSFVVAADGEPVGRIQDGDGVIFFNFRGDRAIELSRAFEDDDFDAFERVGRPQVTYAGMLEYDGDLHIPSRYLVEPPAIANTSGEYLAAAGVTTLAISETQKFGHVTYFWNGNRSGYFDEALETYIEVPSDVVPFEQRPWMKAAEITDELLRQMQTGRFQNVRVNFANGDMVGHTGHYEATRVAVEAVDLALERILEVVDAMQGVLILTADHGNAEEMYAVDKKTGEVQRGPDGVPASKTSHSLNPVPFVLYDNQSGGQIRIRENAEFGLANLTATIVNLLGYAAPEMWEPGILAFDPVPVT